MDMLNKMLIELHASFGGYIFSIGLLVVGYMDPEIISEIKQGIAMEPQYMNSSLYCHLIGLTLFHKNVTRFALDHCGCGDIPG